VSNFTPLILSNLKPLLTVKAGIAQARQDGKPHGRPPTAKAHTVQVKQLYAQGLNKSQIARQLGIGRTSVRRILEG